MVGINWSSHSAYLIQSFFFWDLDQLPQLFAAACKAVHLLGSGHPPHKVGDQVHHHNVCHWENFLPSLNERECSCHPFSVCTYEADISMIQRGLFLPLLVIKYPPEDHKCELQGKDHGGGRRTAVDDTEPRPAPCSLLVLPSLTHA